MIKIATIEQTRAIEEVADAAGYSYQQMMESAGRAAADRALAWLDGITEPRVTVLVGSGNNGGDGLVAGLFIAQDRADADVRFYLLKERDDEYTQTAQQAGLLLVNAADDHDKRLLRQQVSSADLVIDALFGIGVRLPIRDEARKMLQQTNRALSERRRARPEQVTVNPAKTAQVPQPAPIHVLAIDCPSGLNCDTGELDANAIHADETVTFITAKHGQFVFPGAAAIGDLTVADIGTPQHTDAHKAVNVHLVDNEHVQQHLPARTVDSHKGTYGKTMVVAGSANYVGAASLAAEAAYRAGTGLVTVAAPGVIIGALAGRLREATWLMLPNDMGVIAESAVEVLLKDLADYDALLIGPGMGTEKTTRAFMKELLSQKASSPKPSKRRLGFHMADDDTDAEDTNDAVTLPPLVIDADGLNMLAELDDWSALLPPQTIITPHPGEMARLTDANTTDVQAQRLDLAREKAAAWGVVIVLKGAHTVIASPEGELALLPFKTDALATAGTGDVLAGLITGFRAQGLGAFDAAVCGGYVHGIAGEKAGQLQSSRSVLAGDVLDAVGAALTAIDT